MGKTRVALEVARVREDADGPWFVELASVADAASIADTISSTMGLTSAAGIEVLVDLLADRTTVLVLDNCEHVVMAVADLCGRILTACLHVRILATSRERLGVPGEQQIALGPLDDSVDLFCRRASGTSADELAAHRATIETICAAIDHIPLAVELAAAQTSVLSVPQILGMLTNRFELLHGGRGAGTVTAADDRHTSMRAAITGSYESLTDSEQRLFTDLSIFEGGFDFDAAREVTGHPGLLGDLGALIGKSMVTVIGGDPRRYRILETLREYAREHLEDARATKLLAAHSRWVADLCERSYLTLRGPDCLRWSKRLDTEMPNIRAALGRCAPTSAEYLAMVGSVYWFWYRRGLVAEGMRVLAPVIDAGADVPLPVRIRATCGRVIMSYLGGDLGALMEALGHLDGLLALTDPGATERTDRIARGDAAVTLGFFQSGAGAVEIGRERAVIALQIAADTDYPWTAAEAHLALGTAALRAGDHGAASECFEEAIRVAQGCGYDWCVASSHVAAGELIGVVERRTELTGYAPERMDVVELATYATTMRGGIDPAVLAAARDRGRSMSSTEVSALIGRCVDAR